MIDSQQVQYGCMQIVHVHFVFLGVVTEIVRCAMAVPGLDSGSAKLDRKPCGIMIASVGSLCHWCSTELGAPYDKRIFEQPALFEVGQ